MAEVFGSDSDEDPSEPAHVGRAPDRATRQHQTATRTEPQAAK